MKTAFFVISFYETPLNLLLALQTIVTAMMMMHYFVRANFVA